MKEKFRLRCDLNEITDIEDMDTVADTIATFSHIVPYHRYSYLFRGYHDLVHGKIDDETFFAIGDISSTHELFAHAPRAGLETVFLLADTIADETLYLVEQSAWEYYHGKVGHDKSDALHKELVVHGSKLIVV